MARLVPRNRGAALQNEGDTLQNEGDTLQNKGAAVRLLRPYIYCDCGIGWARRVAAQAGHGKLGGGML